MPLSPPPRRRRNPIHRALLGLLACMAGLGLAACAQTPSGRPPGSDDPDLDPTAIRLHDLAGQLLLYRVQHGQYPAQMQDLAGVSVSAKDEPLIDPASGQPFSYAPTGVRVPSLPGRMLAWQAVGTQPAMRWGLFMDTGGPGRQIAAYVLRVPESALKAALAGQSEPSQP